MRTAGEALHSHLIGIEGSRARLNTPALILDLDLFERNLRTMADVARHHGLALRPHAKTHKSADVARAQIAAGAVGQCCAKLGEAEALAAAGIGGLLITSPVVTPMGVARLAALNARTSGLGVVVDHPDNLDAIAAACAGGEPMRVLIDIDPGFHRTGVATSEGAVALARRAADHAATIYAGVQFYCGPEQHIAEFAARRVAISERTAYLAEIVRRLGEAGLAPAIVTGGGTGSHAIDAELGVLTELQPGSYAFMDREYGACDLQGSFVAPFATALMIDARVVSANGPAMATIDAGLKAFATEAGPPQILSGAPSGSVYRFAGDEHGTILPPFGDGVPALGSRVTLGAPHCDPTVNLYDAYHVVRGETLVAIWPVTARGRSA